MKKKLSSSQPARQADCYSHNVNSYIQIGPSRTPPLQMQMNIALARKRCKILCSGSMKGVLVLPSHFCSVTQNAQFYQAYC